MMALNSSLQPLSEQTRFLVKSTAPLLAEKGVAVTTCMYRRMFTLNPEMNAYFNPAGQVPGGQPHTLALALYAYATHIDNVHALAPVIERIAQKHVSLGVVPEHYPVVGEHLLHAMREVLAEAATEEVVAAWAEAYGLLAHLFIRRESEIYAEKAQATGGWEGYRPLRVARKEQESDTVVSLYLEPTDGRPLAEFRPGQYITLKFNDIGPHGTRRNYSLSDRPGLPYYRLTIKREPPADPGLPPGCVSTRLHDSVGEGDTIEVGPPCGDFVLPDRPERPVVLLSAGVGLTPVLSMFRHLAHQGSTVPVYFVHGTRNRATHAFGAEVRAIAREHEGFHAHVCYSAPTSACVAGADHDTRGRVTPALIRDLVPGPDCSFYVVGPAPFMRAMRQGLRAWGVPDSQVRFEFFGPAQGLD